MKADSYCTMNRILSKFADNSPIFQQALLEQLHNWGLEVTPTRHGVTVYALTITPLPQGRGFMREIEQARLLV